MFFSLVVLEDCLRIRSVRLNSKKNWENESPKHITLEVLMLCNVSLSFGMRLESGQRLPEHSRHWQHQPLYAGESSALCHCF